MQENLRHVGNSDGSLEVNIPESIFLAKISHRIKVMTGPVFKMFGDTQDPRRCKKMDAHCLKHMQVVTYTKP